MNRLLQTATETYGLDKTKEIFKNRFSALLKKNDMSQMQLSRELANYLDIKTFRQATISVWTNGKALPRTKYLDAIADILNVDAEYLLGLQENTRKNVVIKNTNGALEIRTKNLKNYDNEPVWCVNKESDMTNGFWALVDANTKHLVTNSTKIPFKNINFSVYSFISPYSFAIDSNLEIYTKEEVRSAKKLWVQGIGGSYESRKKINGYYTYDNDIDCVVSKSGYTLSLNTYGVNWVAYNEKIIEKEPKKLN